MTIVRGEENGNNGHHAGGGWRGGRSPSSRDTRAGALARPSVGSTEASFPKGDLGRRSSALRALPRNQCVFLCRRCNTGQGWLPTYGSGPFSAAAPCTHVPGRYLSKIPVSMVRNKKRPLAGVLGANWVQHWKCDPYAATMREKPGLGPKALNNRGCNAIAVPPQYERNACGLGSNPRSPG